MKPIFTIHEGEFLVGDYINRELGHKYNVWVPTKDSGVDLLVTRKRGKQRAVGLQVKFSRSFDIEPEFASFVKATSWFKLDPKKIHKSQADLWVFVILTLRHDQHFVIVPTRELKKLVRGLNKTWNIYLHVCGDKSCYQVRDLDEEEKREIYYHGVRDKSRDFSQWLGNWKVIDRLSN